MSAWTRRSSCLLIQAWTVNTLCLKIAVCMKYATCQYVCVCACVCTHWHSYIFVSFVIANGLKYLKKLHFDLLVAGNSSFVDKITVPCISKACILSLPLHSHSFSV